MRMIRVVLSIFASVTNGITERTRSLHDGSLMNAASRHFRYFSEAEHHGIFCFAALQEAARFARIYSP
jgi:hypothetical protein